MDSSMDDSSGCYTTLDEKKDSRFIFMDNVSLGRLSLANAVMVDATPPGSNTPLIVGPQNFAIVNYAPGEHFFFSCEWRPSSLGAGPGKRDRTRTYKIGEFGQRFEPIGQEHLSMHSWTLQERLLTPRTLHLTKSQMF